MMDREAQEGLEALRKFLRPTLRGKARAYARRLSARLFPPKPIPRFKAGDILSFNGKEQIVAKCRGRYVEFTDGSEMVV